MAIPGYYSLLQRGSSGPDVALVQTWLNGVRDACTWYDALKADGKFGGGNDRLPSSLPKQTVRRTKTACSHRRCYGDASKMHRSG